MQARIVFRRVVVTLVGAATVTGGMTGMASPALAGHAEIARSTWAYVDVHEPRMTFAESDAPVGAWRDDRSRLHSSKSYFTFDLSALDGRVLYVEAYSAEMAANDCGKPRSTEMWVSDAADHPTWIDQPRELGKLPGPFTFQHGCVASRVHWDATAAVEKALATGQTRLTLALRMPERQQFDVAYGRRYGNTMRLSVLVNRPPSIPTDLTPCGESQFLSTATPDLAARFDDPDRDQLTGTFAIWPVEEPARRTEMIVHTSSGSRAFRPVPAGVLADAGTYEWAVRASDDTDTSEWSAPCRFTVDVTPPAAEPGVSSTDYPENCPFPFCGGIGIPGQFTFTANGVADVAGFRYGTSEPVAFVPADQLGGGATVTVVPRGPGFNQLVVRSVDRAGNPSPPRQYTYFVRDTRPIVSCVPDHGELGQPRECTFAPGMPGVISYRYRFDNGPEVTIPANSDGVATVTLRPVNPFSPTLDVTSITADGIETTLNFFIFVAPSAPEAVSDTYPQFDYGGGVGVTGEFRFSPRMPNVAEYVYQFDDDPEIVFAADADGRATISFTPSSPDGHFLQVRSRTSDGVTSQPTNYTFFVNPTG